MKRDSRSVQLSHGPGLVRGPARTASTDLLRNLQSASRVLGIGPPLSSGSAKLDGRPVRVGWWWPTRNQQPFRAFFSGPSSRRTQQSRLVNTPVSGRCGGGPRRFYSRPWRRPCEARAPTFSRPSTGGLAKPISKPALAQVFLDETLLHHPGRCFRRSRLFQVWQIDAAVGFARAC